MGKKTNRVKALFYTSIFLFFSISLLFCFTKNAKADTLDGYSATITPTSISASQWGGIHVTLHVGTMGIAQGGKVKIYFPKSFTAPKHYLQTTSPSGNYYVRALTSNPSVSISLQLINQDLTGEGRSGRDWSGLITVTNGNLNPGDTITYIFGDTTSGGKGIVASETVATELVRISVDSQGNGVFQELSKEPTISTLGLTATSLAAYIESSTLVGTAVKLSVTAMDKRQNNSSSYQKNVNFTSSDPSAIFSSSYKFLPADYGNKTFTVVFNTPGVQRITVSDGTFTATTNPIIVNALPASNNLYWGDLHIHTDFSPEAYGNPQSMISYGKNVSRLDFFSFLDHAGNISGPLTPTEWQSTKDIINQNYDPGTFATLLGYEWSNLTPQGHRSVYYRDTNEPFFGAADYNTIPNLWNVLQTNNKPALTVPHHTGISSQQEKNLAVDFSYANPTYQRLIEIFQSKGQSEYYNPADPLSYENLSVKSISVQGAHYARDAWAMGQKLGVIGSSDEHNGKPGRTGRGLAAVYSPTLTREGIFDALSARHTYATTGERILLGFTSAGYMMGDEYSASIPPTFQIDVVGTDIVDSVELMKYNGTSYLTIYSINPNSLEAHFSYTDSGFNSNSFYYLRVHQAKQIMGEDVRAWSSPIWINKI